MSRLAKSFSSQKVNSIDPDIKKRFEKKEFKAATNYSVAMGRVSIKRNKDKGNSDVAQIEHLEEYMSENNLVLATKPWDVAETASKHEKRKNFFELVEFVEDSQSTDKPVKHVLFAYTSRGSRNKQSKRMIESLLDLGVAVHFTQDGLVLHNEADMATWLTWQVKSIKDEEDIEKLRKHIWDGTIKRLELGLLPGKAPFGFLNRRISELGDLSIFIHDGWKAEWMKGFFELLGTDVYTISEAKRLLDLQILVPINTEREANDLPLYKTPSETRLCELARNPFYYGDFMYMEQLWQGHPEYHPPLVNFSLWQSVQENLDRREHRDRKDRTHPYLQLLRCGGHYLDEESNETESVCNHAITAEEKRKKLLNGEISYHYYYRCCSKPKQKCSQRDKEWLKAHGRTRMAYTEAELEELFLEKIIRPLNITREDLARMTEALLAHHKQACEAERKKRGAKQSRFEMLIRYQDQAYEDRLNGVISPEMYREKSIGWRIETEQIKAELEASVEDHDERIRKGIEWIELVQDIESIWKKAKPEQKARILKIVGSNLTLRNGSIEFNYRKPFDLFAFSTGSKNWWSLAGSNR